MEGIRTILCPVDFTAVSEETVHLAANLCRQMKAKLILHHNLGVRPPGFLSVNWFEVVSDRLNSFDRVLFSRLETVSKD